MIFWFHLNECICKNIINFVFVAPPIYHPMKFFDIIVSNYLIVKLSENQALQKMKQFQILFRIETLLFFLHCQQIRHPVRKELYIGEMLVCLKCQLSHATIFQKNVQDFFCCFSMPVYKPTSRHLQ